MPQEKDAGHITQPICDSFPVRSLTCDGCRDVLGRYATAEAGLVWQLDQMGAQQWREAFAAPFLLGYGRSTGGK